MAGVGCGVFGEKSASVKAGKSTVPGRINSSHIPSPMAVPANAPTPASAPTRQVGGGRGTSQIHRRPHPYPPGRNPLGQPATRSAILHQVPVQPEADLA